MDLGDTAGRGGMDLGATAEAAGTGCRNLVILSRFKLSYRSMHANRL